MKTTRDEIDRVKRSQNLSTAQKFILLELISLSNNDEGFCYASNRYLADHWGTSTDNVCGYLNALEEKGFIRREFENNNKRRIYINHATINDRRANEPSKRNSASIPATAKDFFQFFKTGPDKDPGDLETSNRMRPRQWNQSKELRRALEAWLEMRKGQGKFVTRTEVKGLASYLVEHSKGDLSTAIQIVRSSAENRWDRFGPPEGRT